MIESMIIKETRWNEDLEKYEVLKKIVDREDDPDGFDEMLLENIKSDQVIDYAYENLNMIREGSCGCRQKTLEDYQDFQIIRHMQDYGYELVKCQTIADKMKLDEIIEQYGLNKVEA